jgi:transcriptional regulator with XRE-family HTH domain
VNKPSETIRFMISLVPYTLRELARRSGVSVSTLSRFMSGKGKLDADSLDALAGYFKLELIQRPTR